MHSEVKFGFDCDLGSRSIQKVKSSSGFHWRIGTSRRIWRDLQTLGGMLSWWPVHHSVNKRLVSDEKNFRYPLLSMKPIQIQVQKPSSISANSFTVWPLCCELVREFAKILGVSRGVIESWWLQARCSWVDHGLSPVSPVPD